MVIPQEAVSQLPQDVQQKILQISVQQTQMWSGPIPSPDALEKYNHVLPGSANRLLSLAEKEQNHRHDMDRNVLATKAGDVKRGQRYGFVIAIFAVGGAVWCASFAPWVSGVLVSVPVATIVIAFIKGRSK